MYTHIFSCFGGWASQMSLGAMHRTQQWSSSAHYSFQMWRTWLETIICLLEEDSVLQGDYFFMNKLGASCFYLFIWRLYNCTTDTAFAVCWVCWVRVKGWQVIDWGVSGQHFNAWHNFTQNCRDSPKFPIAQQLVPVLCPGDRNMSSSCCSKKLK